MLQFRWPSLDERVAAVGILLLSAAVLTLGFVDSVILALVPLPIAIGIGMVRNKPGLVAASLPLVCIGIDGVLVDLQMQTPVRVSSGVVLLLIWVVLTGRMQFHPRAFAFGVWFAVLLISNYFLITVPFGVVVDPKVLLLLLEGFIVVGVVATFAPSPQTSVSALSIAGLIVSYSAFFPQYTRGGRPYAIGLDPNSIGTILAVGIVALATLARIRRSWYPLLAVVPMVGALIQVQSRAAAITMVVGLAGVASLASTRFRSYLVLFVISAFFAVGALMGLQPGYGAFTERRNDTELSSKAREDIREVGFSAVRSAPIGGVGVGVVAVQAAATVSVQHDAVSHNEYLRLAAEFGIPGLLGVLILMGIPLIVGVCRFDRSSAATVMWPSLGACLTSMAFSNALDIAQLATLIMGIAGVAWGSIVSPTARERVLRAPVRTSR